MPRVKKIDETSLGDRSRRYTFDDVPICTSDKVELVVGSIGVNCKLLVNGELLEGVRDFELKVDVNEPTHLTVHMFYPRGARDENGNPMVRVFKGVFIEEDDWQKIQKAASDRSNEIEMWRSRCYEWEGKYWEKCGTFGEAVEKAVEKAMKGVGQGE